MRTMCGTILVAVCIATCANAADGGNAMKGDIPHRTTFYGAFRDLNPLNDLGIE